MNQTKRKDFYGQSAVVTGCGGGMGMDIARQLLASGASVCGIDLKARPDDLSGFDQSLVYHQGDLTDFRFIDACIKDFHQRHSGLHCLVNAAGVLWFDKDGSFETVDLDVWDQVLNINLKSMLHSSRTAAPLMRSTGGGSMVHFSSIQCLRGDDRPQDAYQASKAAVIALSKSIAIQNAPFQIRSNVILPGPTHTPMQQRWDMQPGAKTNVAKHIPLGRVGSAADMANACLFLLSERAAFITGTELIVDGGLTARP